MDTRRFDDIDPPAQRGSIDEVSPAEWDSMKVNRYRGLRWTTFKEEEAHGDNYAYDEAASGRAFYQMAEEDKYEGYFKGRASAKWTPQAAVVKENNPKKRIGALKAPMHLIPPVASAHLAIALADGAAKYGSWNFRASAISSSTYLGAIHRHLALYLDGEDCATDSGVHHIAAAMAGCAILLDCMAAGQLVDDRPPATTGVSELFEAYHKEQRS